MSIDRWIDKEDVIHIYNGILLSHKKEGNNAICSNMDGPRDYHSKWCKSGTSLAVQQLRLHASTAGCAGSIPGQGTKILHAAWRSQKVKIKNKNKKTKWSKSERERQIWYHLHVESKIWHKWTYLQNGNRLTGIENRLWLPRGAVGKGWPGILGLADANYYI